VIYLDYQATTPLAPEAREAMLPWLTADGSANPHSTHVPGRAAKAAVESAREQVASLLPLGGQVFFTSGATEAANWAIRGITNQGGIMLPETEHACVRDTALFLQTLGHDVTLLPVSQDGLVDPHTLIPDGTALVAAMLVNNEIGVIQPLEALANAAHAAGALFFCDAVQAYGRLRIPDGCDMIAISAHKIHGPKGIGALWVRDGIALEPFMLGGGQEWGLRSGTLSPALCAGFGVAAALAAWNFESDTTHIDGLWTVARRRFDRGWIVNGSETQRYPGNLNIRRAGLDAGRLVSELRSVALSTGSACASGSGRPSHVLTALSLSREEARSSLRIGFGRYTIQSDLIDAIEQILAATDRQMDVAA
jgi:cysteine desulfurase